MLLTDFHKNVGFRPSMLNYLNTTTFTFGKKTKDNFINRKVQCRPAYASESLLMHSSTEAFLQGRIQRWAIAPRKTYENIFIYHDFVQFGKHHSRFQGHFVIHCFVTALL